MAGQNVHENKPIIQSLSEIVEESIIDVGFCVDEAIIDALPLTPLGNEVVSAALDSLDDGIRRADAVLGLLAIGPGRSPFFDYENVQAQLLMETVGQHVRSREISHPYQFGDIAYQLFLDLRTGPSPQHEDLVDLDEDETAEFMGQLPQGIAQLGEVLSGPFGISLSGASRWITPNQSIPAYHCQDTGCLATHMLRLSTNETAASSVYQAIMSHLGIQDMKSVGDEYADFARRTNDPHVYNPFDARSIPWLLGECFSPNELRTICYELLNREASSMRSRMAELGGLADLQGSARDISQALDDHAEMMHFLLLANDAQLVGATESAIANGTVTVPQTETRLPREWISPASYYQLWPQASSRGVRFSATRNAEPIDYLRELFLYAFREDESGLDWYLRFVDASEGDRLTAKLLESSPEESVASLLHSHDKYDRICQFMGLDTASQSKPDTPASESVFIDRVLWKLGFDPPSFPIGTDSLTRYVEDLRKVVASARVVGTDHEREAYRSVAVNLFVALEEVLHDSLVFVAWACFEDHFGRTQFVYERSSAGPLGHATLNQALSVQGSEKRIPEDGRVTLGILIDLFTALSEFVRQAANTPSPERRPADQLPSYVEHVRVRRFPFEHLQALDDARPDDRQNLVEALSSAHKLLVERVDIPWMRNCVDHHREDFPTNEDFGALCDVVDALLQLLSQRRLYPYVFYRDRTVSDRYSRRHRYLHNRLGDEIELLFPQPVIQLPQDPDAPQVVSPLRVRESSMPFLFRYVEPSDYRDIVGRRPVRRLGGAKYGSESGVVGRMRASED